MEVSETLRLSIFLLLITTLQIQLTNAQLYYNPKSDPNDYNTCRKSRFVNTGKLIPDDGYNHRLQMVDITQNFELNFTLVINKVVTGEHSQGILHVGWPTRNNGYPKVLYKKGDIHAIWNAQDTKKTIRLTGYELTVGEKYQFCVRLWRNTLFLHVEGLFSSDPSEPKVEKDQKRRISGFRELSADDIEKWYPGIRKNNWGIVAFYPWDTGTQVDGSITDVSYYSLPNTVETVENKPVGKPLPNPAKVILTSPYFQQPYFHIFSADNGIDGDTKTFAKTATNKTLENYFVATMGSTEIDYIVLTPSYLSFFEDYTKLRVIVFNSSYDSVADLTPEKVFDRDYVRKFGSSGLKFTCESDKNCWGDYFAMKSRPGDSFSFSEVDVYKKVQVVENFLDEMFDEVSAAIDAAVSPEISGSNFNIDWSYYQTTGFPNYPACSEPNQASRNSIYEKSGFLDTIESFPLNITLGLQINFKITVSNKIDGSNKHNHFLIKLGEGSQTPFKFQIATSNLKFHIMWSKDNINRNTISWYDLKLSEQSTHEIKIIFGKKPDNKQEAIWISTDDILMGVLNIGESGIYKGEENNISKMTDSQKQVTAHFYSSEVDFVKISDLAVFEVSEYWGKSPEYVETEAVDIAEITTSNEIVATAETTTTSETTAFAETTTFAKSTTTLTAITTATEGD